MHTTSVSYFHIGLCGVAILLNIIQLIRLLRKRKRISADVYFCALYVADVILSAVTFFHLVRSTWFSGGENSFLVILEHSLINYGFILSLMSIWLMTLDRFISVRFPTLKRRFFQKKHLTSYIGVLWIACTVGIIGQVLAKFSVFGHPYKTCHYFATALGITCVYLTVLHCSIIRHFWSSNARSRDVLKEGKVLSIAEHWSRLKRPGKQVLVITISTVVSFLSLNIPFIVYAVLKSHFSVHHQKAETAAGLMLTSNAVLNPVIYFTVNSTSALKETKLKAFDQDDRLQPKRIAEFSSVNVSVNGEGASEDTRL